VLVALIWGTNFVFIRYGLNELQPFTFATLRFILVAIPLVFILPKPNVAWKYLVWYGVFIGFGQFGLLFWAMQENISPGLASLIVQTQVFFTIFLAVLVFQESTRFKQLVALCVCFLGIAIIAIFTDGQTTLLGISVTLIAAASWACGNMVVKKVGQVDVMSFLAWSSLFAVPLLLLMALYYESPSQISTSVLQLSWQGWSVVVWQSVGNTMIGYGLWNMLLNRYDAPAVAPWSFLVPVFGMLASALILSEAMPWWKLLGMALILTGLAINTFNVRFQPSKLF